MVLVNILSRVAPLRVCEAPDASPIFKVWGQQPVHSSLPFSPFGVQRKPNTKERRRCEVTDGIGWMGYQKSPLIFVILSTYIENEYMYLYIVTKIVTNILMDYKI